jgi:acyl carrier protein
VPTPEEVIRQHIAQNILFNNKGYPYPDDASFLDNGIVDSMNVMELIMFVEENFNLEVADEDIIPDNFDSVSKIAAYVLRKATQPASSLSWNMELTHEYCRLPSGTRTR